MWHWRKLIGLLAVLGVLMHASLIVRHSSIMLSAKLAHSDLLSALGEICHGGGGVASSPDSDLPTVPSPGGAISDCPLCMGLGSAVVVLPGYSGVAHVPDAISARQEIVAEIAARRMAAHLPPSTGPPMIV